MTCKNLSCIVSARHTFNFDSHKCSSLYIDYLLDYNTGEEKSSKNLLGSATSEYDLRGKNIAVLKQNELP